MNSSPHRRFLLIFTFIISMLFPLGPASAAIPCGELPIIMPPDDFVMPTNHIELPVEASVFFGQGKPADRSQAVNASESQSQSARMAAINQIRCLNYGVSSAVLGNSTPVFRVLSTGVSDPVQGENYVRAESAHLVQYGDVLVLENGQILIDYTAIIDGERFLDGEMVFADHDDGLYLDSTALRGELPLGEQQVIEVSEEFTREAKQIKMANGDSLLFDNASTESSANIAISDASGATVFVGDAAGDGMVGGETQNIFVAYQLEPGVYEAVITFGESSVSMTIVITIRDNPASTPLATPGT